MYRPGMQSVVEQVGFAGDLARFGTAAALIAPDRTWTYPELDAEVAELTEALGPSRRLVLWEAAATPEAVIAYLAALRGGHPILVVPPGGGPEIAGRYDPDVFFTAADAWRLAARRVGSTHDLHPDLAMLMSTSGSTGSPKLVRLSARNLQANAESIAQYLNLTAADRAITSLPLSYCYGLSVLHSHLLVGAGLVLTDTSVVDECFWAAVQRHRVTGIAGVPHTFELLQRSGFADRDLPALRYLTQAGGRMDPDRVSDFARLGQRRGWDLYVMYGQTEATARMAYLPPDLAALHPDSVGVAIPGGAFELDTFDGAPAGTGELLYRGDNVMLGYAESADDLARGRDIDVLRTGDLARIDDGLVRIVGRRSRFAKVLGLRISLDRVEARLREAGLDAVCVDVEGRLGVLGVADSGRLRQQAAAAAGLPTSAVIAVSANVPRTDRHKSDYSAVRLLCEERLPREDRDGAPAVSELDAVVLRDLYAELLDRPEATELDSFVSLGGDSLSYVEVSVALEERLGRLPAGWHTMAVSDLAAVAGANSGMTTPGRQSRWGRLVLALQLRSMDTTVLLRALAIVLIVGSHIGVFTVRGGAHVLIAVAGFNLARFHLTSQDRASRARSVLRTTARIAIPSVIWLSALVLIASEYPIASAGLVNQWFGPADGPGWRYWFIEVLVVALLVTAALVSSRGFDRLERAWPFAVPAALAIVGLALRYEWLLDLGAKEHYVVAGIVWLFAVGWAAARANSLLQRLIVSGLAVAGAVGYFPSGLRDGVILAGCLALVWLPTIAVPAWLRRVALPLAAASLYIYLTHYTIYPPVRELNSFVALGVSLAAGVGVWLVAERMQTAAGRYWTNRRPSADAVLGAHVAPRTGSQPRALALSRSYSS